MRGSQETAPVGKSLSASPPPPREEVGRCYVCGETKPIGDFYRDASKAAGRMSRCRACDLEKCRRYYEQNRERKLAYMRARNAALREARGGRGRRSSRRAA
jgi:hypothetical protein